MEQVSIDPTLGTYLNSEEARLNALPARSSLAATPYDTLLDKSLADFKDGRLATFEGSSFQQMQRHDLDMVKMPYVIIGLVVLGVMLVFVFAKMPDTGHDSNKSLKLGDTFGRLVENQGYLGRGVRPGPLRRRPDHVLDVHHPLRHHEPRHDGVPGAELQHRGHGDLLLQPVHLHFHAQVRQPRPPADVPRAGRHGHHVGHHLPLRHAGAVSA